MKNILPIAGMISFLSAACFGAPAASATQYKPFAMDKNYFTCLVPADWALERDQEKDEEYRIYEIQLLAPKTGRESTSIFVSYYAKDNEDFNDYQDFIARNSANVLGETKGPRENYAPPKKISLGGRKAIELSRERLVFLHPQTKSDESVQLKEKLYVIPAKEGFYVLHFSAPADFYLPNLPIFEKVAKSLKPLP